MNNCGFTLVEDGAIATLTIDNLKKRNALSLEFFQQVPDKLKELAEGKTKVLIIKANPDGKCFCSGIDINLLGGLLTNPAYKDPKSEDSKQWLIGKIVELQKPFLSLVEAPFPVIGQVNGKALGAGFDLLAACDLRYSIDSAEFVIEEINHALMADLGVLQLLPGQLPSCLANYLAFTGQPLKAKEALDHGFLNGTSLTEDELDTSVKSVAQLIAAKHKTALMQSKQALRESKILSYQDGLLEAARLQAEHLDRDAILSTFKK